MEDETAESPEELLLKQHRKEKKDLQGILRQYTRCLKHWQLKGGGPPCSGVTMEGNSIS